jgi:hypothetical protein
MNCDKCGKPGTLTKTKPRKSDGQTFDIYECSTCMNGKFKYGWFPPREKFSQPSVSPSADLNERLLTNDLLQQINSKLEKILAKLSTETETHTDSENIPF